MMVVVERTKESFSSQESTVAELLRVRDINPETVLVMRDGVLVPEDASLEGAREVRILDVISGG